MNDVLPYLAVGLPAMTVAIMPVVLFILTTRRQDRILHTVDGIHTLVNAQKTASVKSELVAFTGTLAVQEELIAIRKVSRRKPSQELLAATKITREKIAELQDEISERERQTKIAEKQMEMT